MPNPRVGLKVHPNCPIKSKHYFILKDEYSDFVDLYNTVPVVRVKSVQADYIKMGHKETVVYFSDLVSIARNRKVAVVHPSLNPIAEPLEKFIEFYREVSKKEAQQEVALYLLKYL